MTISKDLLLAILSMDSYNRGYGEGIGGLGGIGSQVGAATLSVQSGTSENDPEVAAGFYAAAYTIGAGVGAALKRANSCWHALKLLARTLRCRPMLQPILTA